MEKHSWSFDRHLQRILWGRTVRLQFLKGFAYNPRATLPPMIVPIPTEQATRLLIDWSNGNREAAAALMPLVYEELRRLARGYLQRERPDHTLQATGEESGVASKHLTSNLRKIINDQKLPESECQMFRRDPMPASSVARGTSAAHSTDVLSATLKSHRRNSRPTSGKSRGLSRPKAF